jgi:heme/copper-type cytochrome/quinol oxidase subunit 3
MIEKNKLAMLLFISSETIFFTLLILAYVAYHRTGGTGPTAASALDPVKTGVFSLFLLSSSFTMHRVGASTRREERGGQRAWLAATIVLGSVFLVGQGLEYASLIRRDVTISRDLFGTTFFTLTGFHGLHVFLGLVMLAILLGLGARHPDDEPKSAAVGAIAVYWHFVDAVWVVIFSVVYLWAFV